MPKRSASCSPARACSATPQQAACSSVAPRAARPAMMPASVSPEPEMARPTLPPSCCHSVAVGRGDHGARAFQRHHGVPVLARRARAWPSGSATMSSLASPVRCAISPACGVTMTGSVEAERRLLRRQVGIQDDAHGAGVEHDAGAVQARQQRAHQRRGGGFVLHAGADQDRVDAVGQRVERGGRVAREAAVVGFAPGRSRALRESPAPPAGPRWRRWRWSACRRRRAARRWRPG